MAILRSILAIIGGYIPVVIIVLSGYALVMLLRPDLAQSTPGLILLLSIACIAAIVGGLVTAAIAARRPIIHAAILGLLMSSFGILRAAFPDPNISHQPTWYLWSIGLLALPAAVLGGLLYVRIRRPHTPA
jgi:hypothetical protein